MYRACILACAYAIAQELETQGGSLIRGRVAPSAKYSVFLKYLLRSYRTYQEKTNKEPRAREGAETLERTRHMNTRQNTRTHIQGTFARGRD